MATLEKWSGTSFGRQHTYYTRSRKGGRGWPMKWKGRDQVRRKEREWRLQARGSERSDVLADKPDEPKTTNLSSNPIRLPK
ncbi:hypothetical protein J6590_095345 [Homalodisca vitripennis]|nr:hypothetical protein J6590_095345 [Homalodisca vitripennis]